MQDTSCKKSSKMLKSQEKNASPTN